MTDRGTDVRCEVCHRIRPMADTILMAGGRACDPDVYQTRCYYVMQAEEDREVAERDREQESIYRGMV